MNEKRLYHASIILTFFIFMGVFMYSRYPYMVTDDALSYSLSSVKHLEKSPARVELKEVDGWGHPLVFYFERRPKVFVYRVVSKGPDGIEGTADDCSKEYIDDNVSEYLEEFSQILSGLAKGLKGAKK